MCRKPDDDIDGRRISRRAWYESQADEMTPEEKRRGRWFPGHNPLVGALMCNKDDDDTLYGPGTFNATGGRRDPDPGDHRGLFFGLLPLVLLACGSKSPGGREEDDPMHHRLKREGKTLRDQLGLGGNGDDRKRRFVADAWDILTGPTKGGRFLAAHDARGWFHYVFLDESVERHPYNCRYVRMLRAVRGVGRIGGVA